MSWLPLYNSWLICLALMSLFYWNLGFVGLACFIFLFSLLYLVIESTSWSIHFPMGFWLFIGSEIMVFLTMFLLVFYKEACPMVPISEGGELPFLGTFLLIGSSVTATRFHHGIGLKYNVSYLLLTLFLGVCFVFLQLRELYDCGCDILMDSFYCASFCTVGLHFVHVVIGLFLLSLLLFLLPKGLDRFYGDLGVWYWHFVDYIWLAVLFIVYFTSR